MPTTNQKEQWVGTTISKIKSLSHFLPNGKRKLKKTAVIAEKEVEVLSMASEEDCESNMYVEVAYIGESDDTFTAKLSDIEAINPDPATEEALADWQYWIDMNYGF
jgi:hypothetical protein